jgi:pimeloyl-ACP methyl ester carboxylesterase
MAGKILFCRNSAGDRFAYTVFGDGPILLVTPPWISSLEVQLEDPAWMGLYGRLARKHTVVTLDKQGCGLSDRDRSDYSLDRDVDDALTVVDQLGQDRFALFGSSQGGPLAVGVAAARPDQVTHLALYGSYVRGSSVLPGGDTAFVNVVRASWGLGSRAFATLFLPLGIDDPTAMRIVLRWERAAASHEIAARLLEALFSWDVTDLAAGLDVPTLVMHRRHDRAFPARVGRDLAAAIPGSRFVLLDGDGHVPWYGDTDAVLTNLAEFLGDDPAQILRPLAPPQPVEVAVRPVDLRESATATDYSARLSHLDVLGPE